MARVAVVGAGTMGAGLVRLLARAGHRVTVFDERRSSASDVASSVPGAVAADRLANAVAGIQWCVEAIVEELGAKRELFAALATAAPSESVLASNTSALSIDAIAEGVAPEVRPRVVGAHFFNPPDIVPAVEVVRGTQSSKDAIDFTVGLLKDAGKTVAVVRDVPGFVANRIQMAMVAEAWRCLEEDVASPEDIDAIVSASFGFRLFAYGPFALGDFNGLDVYESVFASLASAYGDRFKARPPLKRLADEGKVGVKAGAGVYEYPDRTGAEAVHRRDRLLERLARLRDELLDDGP
jgi:3-hydroxybutyryl-CoA dehydrogenase